MWVQIPPTASMMHEKYFLIIAFLAAVSGCVSESTTVSPAPDTVEAIAETFSYAATDYPGMSEIPKETTGYPLLLDDPLMALPIKYYINESTINYSYAVFYPEMVNDTIEGLEEWERATDGAVRFAEAKEPSDASVVINFVKFYNITSVMSGEYGLSWTSQLGEGGPASIIPYRGFNLINSSVMFVFPNRQDRCETVQTAEHEFGHATGLDHDGIPDSIMYASVRGTCLQKFKQPTIDAVNSLYKNSKPDLRFAYATASESNGTFDIDMKVENVGLAYSGSVSLKLYDGSFFVWDGLIRPLAPGGSEVFLAKGLKMKPSNDSIQAFIDIESAQEELSREDNEIVLRKQ